MFDAEEAIERYEAVIRDAFARLDETDDVERKKELLALAVAAQEDIDEITGATPPIDFNNI